MSIEPGPVEEVARVALAIAAVGAVSLIILFRSARAGARGQSAIAAGLAALSIILVVILSAALAVRGVSHADAHSTTYAAVWAFAAYVLMLFGPLAPALLRYSRSRVTAPATPAGTSLPAGFPWAYWTVEVVTLILVSAAVLTGMRALGFGPSAELYVVVPLCLALPPFLRSAVGGRFYGRRLLRAAHLSTAEPENLAELRVWTDATARAVGLGRCTVLVLPIASTFVVPLWGSAHLIVIDARLFAALDPQDRRALVAHEIAHAERNDANRRALLIMGVTLWLFVLMDLWGTRSRQWPVATMYVSIFIFITVLDYARRTLSHRAEYAADRRAAEIVGDRQAMIRTLTRMAQRRGSAANRDTRSHPSLAKRIATLQS